MDRRWARRSDWEGGGRQAGRADVREEGTAGALAARTATARLIFEEEQRGAGDVDDDAHVSWHLRLPRSKVDRAPPPQAALCCLFIQRSSHAVQRLEIAPSSAASAVWILDEMTMRVVCVAYVTPLQPSRYLFTAYQ